MEDLVELGFEGVDKFADKYHDRVYGHLPAWKQKQQKQEKQQQQQQQQQRPDQQEHKKRGEQGDQNYQQRHQDDRGPPVNEHRRQRSDSALEENQDDRRYDRDMSSYANSYAPNGRQDYRDERDVRIDRFNQPHAPSPPVGYGYDNRREVGYADQGRPAPYRQRSTSWSPPRSERRDESRRDDSRRRRRSRSRSRDKDETKLSDRDSTRRLAATIVGGLVGGFAGNQVQKGKKYDTAATIGGAILGGIASREIAERVGHKREDRKEKLEDQQEAWEQKYGDDDRDRDDRRRNRDSRGWCDRCRCEKSRCWCK